MHFSETLTCRLIETNSTKPVLRLSHDYQFTLNFRSCIAANVKNQRRSGPKKLLR